MTENHHQSGYVIRRYTLYSLLSLTLIIVITYMIGMRVWICNFKPLGISQTIIIKKGTTLTKLAHTLKRDHLICNAFAFKLLGLATQQSRLLQAGTYQISPHMSAFDLLQAITHGRVKIFYLRILPGQQWQQVSQALQANTHLHHDLDAQYNPKGQLYPDTYAYIDGTSERDLLRHATQRMQAAIASEWRTRDKNLAYQSPTQALIMASILEKEAASYDDQRHIAGILLNRLKHHMYLDSNATVRYGLHLKPQQHLLHSDYQSENPYNTYRHKGLPPQPIAFPDKQALMAALHPLKTNDYYFMSTPQGRMIYGQTYADQKKAIKRYGLNH